MTMSNSPAPKFIPSTEELNRLERELRFHPSTVENPRTLTAEQVAAFNRDGYLKGIRIFSEEEIAGIRRYFDDLLARTLAAGGDSYSISTAHLRYGRVYDLLTDPRIVGCVKDLLGEDVIAWGSHFFCKMPGDGKRVSWHQDASYWPLTPSKAVTVVAGNRRCGRGERLHAVHSRIARARPPDVHAERERRSQRVEPDGGGVEKLGEPIPVELKAGEISIHSDLLLHGSEANQSTRRRCGLTLRYCPADVRARLGWNAKGVIVSGRDEAGHWGNAARPETE